jgi:hypothetical protein
VKGFLLSTSERNGSSVASEGWDVIGDIHGDATKLQGLLTTMGYTDEGAGWKHRSRRAIFVGDLIDRGPAQAEVVEIARTMVQRGNALIAAGNHEFNAIAFATRLPNGEGYCRPHTDKNRKQHREYLYQIGWNSDLHRQHLEWFRTLPLAVEVDGLRVVHACWDDASLDALESYLADDGGFSPNLIHAAANRGSESWQAIEHLLKGPEVPLPRPYEFPAGVPRHEARLQWWRPEATRLDEAVWIPGGATEPDGSPYVLTDDSPFVSPVEPYRSLTPVIVGHYWFRGEPKPCSAKVACVDYSAAKGGPLVAYRWSGETELLAENFTTFE